jgi:outer membrane protein TolC
MKRVHHKPINKQAVYTFAALLILMLSATGIMAQTKLTLADAIEIASNQSLDALKAKNNYLYNYWDYQSYKSRQMPHLNWQLNPAVYNRRMTMRYDFQNDIDVYREQQTLSSFTGLSLSQNIVATGGRIYLESDIYRLQNFNDGNITSWSSTPVRIGFNQPLFGFNRYKWEKKISPLKFNRSQQDYLLSSQQVARKATDLYFSYILAKLRCEISKNYVATADTLHQYGTRRFDIASIAREELLDLELSKFNAQIDLAQAEKDLEKVRFSLTSFLGLTDAGEIETVLPGMIDGLLIDLPYAFDMAKKNNPQILRLSQRELEAERSLDMAEKNARFNANLNMSYGLNQTATSINDAYQKPLDQQMVSLNMNIPILDWGDRKGQKLMAQKELEVVNIEVKQSLIDFEQQIKLKVIDFNLQMQVVLSAAKADSLAAQSYELTKQRFMLGKADVMRLNNSMMASQRASEKYINSLATYWRFLFEVQEFTLYDFINNKPLVFDTEE